MRLAVIADIHSNLEALTVVLGEIDRIGADEIICLGDIVGYGPNPNECVDIVISRGIETIMGNHDAVASGVIVLERYNDSAASALQWTIDNLRDDLKCYLRGLKDSLLQSINGLTVLGVHGSPSNRDDYILDIQDTDDAFYDLAVMDVDVCFFGHSHMQAFYQELKGDSAPAEMVVACEDPGTYDIAPDTAYLINPGSVGQPRDDDCRAAFGILDTESMAFTEYRVEYDIDSVCRKIGYAGLPKKLGSRLYIGR